MTVANTCYEDKAKIIKIFFLKIAPQAQRNKDNIGEIRSFLNTLFSTSTQEKLNL